MPLGIASPLSLRRMWIRRLAAHRIPKNVASHASALRRGRTWVVSVSGGVELDVPRVVNAAELQVELREARIHASPKSIESWWWD